MGRRTNILKPIQNTGVPKPKGVNMETRLELNEDEIKKAITYWIINKLDKSVRLDTITDMPDIYLYHLEDDRASGTFNYHAYIKIEN